MRNSATDLPFEGPDPSCRRPDLQERIVDAPDLGPASQAELARHAAECPSCGPRWQRLNEAEAWLLEQAELGAGFAGPCPDADELFTFGADPALLGGEELDPERHEEIEDHVEACPSCRSMVATLAVRPPGILILGNELSDAVEDSRTDAAGTESPETDAATRGLSAPGHLRTADEGSPVSVQDPEPVSDLDRGAEPRTPGPHRQPEPGRIHTPGLAAAAAVLIACGLGWRLLGTGDPGTSAHEVAGEAVYPTVPTLRGHLEAPLLAPRGRVLPSPGAHGPELRFELDPTWVAEHSPEEIRLTLAQASDDPFLEGSPVARLVGLPGDLVLQSEAFAALDPGHYTLEAWALESGIDRSLGAVDFEIRPSPELTRGFEGLRELPPGAEREAAALALLFDCDAAGYHADARRLAREELPPSEARQAWLARRPTQ